MVERNQGPPLERWWAVCGCYGGGLEELLCWSRLEEPPRWVAQSFSLVAELGESASAHPEQHESFGEGGNEAGHPACSDPLSEREAGDAGVRDEQAVENLPDTGHPDQYGWPCGEWAQSFLGAAGWGENPSAASSEDWSARFHDAWAAAPSYTYWTSPRPWQSWSHGKGKGRSASETSPLREEPPTRVAEWKSPRRTT